MKLSGQFLGSAEITPKHGVIAGSFGTWVIVYTAGKYGIDDQGTIRIAWRGVSDWGQPQFSEPSKPGFTTVVTSGNARVKAETSTFQRPFQNSLLIHLYDGYLKEGEKIIITLGDTARGSVGIRAQSFQEKRHEIKVLVDPFGTRKYEELPEPLVLSVEGGPAHEIQVVVPSLINKYEDFDIVLRCLDEWGNPCRDFEGPVALEVLFSDGKKVSIPGKVHFTREDGGVKRVRGNHIDQEGTFFIEAICPEKRLKALSNPLKCSANNKYKLFWGDMHGQTDLTVGTGDLESYFGFARDFAALDFTGWQGNDFEIDNQKWLEVREKTETFNSPGSFVAFLGYEWSGLTPGGGDHNLYFLGDSKDFFPSCNWLVAREKVDPGLNAYPISKLWKILEGRQDVMLIPHIGGRYANLDYFNPDFIKLIEVHSHHGTFEWFIFEAMKRKLKVGFVASSDDHTCRPGLSYPLGGEGFKLASFDVKSGFAGVFAKELSREGIWEALNSRRCYATTFARIFLQVRIGKHSMGEEITSSDPPEIEIECLGTAPIEKIQIYNWGELILEKNFSRFFSNKGPIKRIKIIWGGVRVRTRSKSANWNGMLTVQNGRIIEVREIAFDRVDQGIKQKTDKFVEWTSTTSGDFDGIEVEIESGEGGSIGFYSPQLKFRQDIGKISNRPIIYDAGGENLKVEVVSGSRKFTGIPEIINSCKRSLKFHDLEVKRGGNAYWVKIIQEDGNMAWSSPIFLEKI